MDDSGHSLVWKLTPRATRLKWEERNLQGHYARAIQSARESGDRAKVEQLEREEMHEVLSVREESAHLYTRTLLEEADALRVPTPNLSDSGGQETGFWEQGRHSGEQYLTTKGIAVLRSAIRAERRARWEDRGHMLAWITAITGLIGTLTGLVAVWLTVR
jgi:hypothetical protein